MEVRMELAGMTRGARRTYLVVSDDYLVAQDLAETILWQDASAQIFVRHAASDAMAVLQGIEALEVAFVGAGPDQFVATGLREMIGQRGGRVVLMGDSAETSGETKGWSVLHRPFSQWQVLSHLAELAER
jgi:hypothetical protein